jgi:hypothetical protein
MAGRFDSITIFPEIINSTVRIAYWQGFANGL